MINFLDVAQGLGTNTVPTQGLAPDYSSVLFPPIVDDDNFYIATKDDRAFCIATTCDAGFEVAAVDDRAFCIPSVDDRDFDAATSDDRGFCIATKDEEE